MRQNCKYDITYTYRLTENEEIVLGRRENYNREPSFVTWLCMDGNNYFWGHYFDNEIKALDDFISRIKLEVCANGK